MLVFISFIVAKFSVFDFCFGIDVYTNFTTYCQIPAPLVVIFSTVNAKLQREIQIVGYKLRLLY